MRQKTRFFFSRFPLFFLLLTLSSQLASVISFAQLRGGSDDYEEFYCAAIEWDWDDDTRSSTTPDCDPYEPGQSKIRRRFSIRHEFEYPGRYTIRVFLRKSGEVVATARTVLELRGGRFN